MKAVIIALFVFSSLHLFCAGQRQISFDEEFSLELLKIKVNPSDKMKIIFDNNTIVKIALENNIVPKILSFKKLEIRMIKTFRHHRLFGYSKKEYIKITSLFKAAGDEAYKKLLAYYKKTENDHNAPYRNISDNRDAMIKADLFHMKIKVKMLKEAVLSFNEAVTQSADARLKIEIVYRNYIKRALIKRIERDRLKRKNIKPSFLYFAAGVSHGNDILPSEASLGIRYSHYFLNAARKNNFGIIIDHYITFFRHYDYPYKDHDQTISKQKYLSLDILLGFKFHTITHMSSLMFNLGLSGNVKIDGPFSINFETHTINYKSFFTSAIAELGYLFISENLKFSFFVSIFIKAGLTKRFTGYEHGRGIFAGVKSGLGFGV